MALQNDDHEWAAAILAWAGGVPSFTTNRGFASLTDNGAGDVSLTLSQALDPTERLVLAMPILPTAALITCVQTSDTVIQILVWDAAGAALDNVPLAVRVMRVPNLS